MAHCENCLNYNEPIICNDCENGSDFEEITEGNVITLGLYFEIKDSELYGGEGSVGYANTNVDLKIGCLENTNIYQYVKKQTKGIAEMCNVDVGKVKVISRTEYQKETDEDEEYDDEYDGWFS